MEGISATVYKEVKGYWRRKGYKRIDGPGREPKTAQLGGDGSTGSGTKKRFWRFKIKPKLKFFSSSNIKLFRSPKKILLKLRDGYVNMMVGFSTSRVCNTGYGSYGGGGGARRLNGFGTRPMKEYDQTMLVEIYKSLVLAQGHLLHQDNATKIVG